MSRLGESLGEPISNVGSRGNPLELRSVTVTALKTGKLPELPAADRTQHSAEQWRIIRSLHGSALACEGKAYIALGVVAMGESGDGLMSEELIAKLKQYRERIAQCESLHKCTLPPSQRVHADASLSHQQAITRHTTSRLTFPSRLSTCSSLSRSTRSASSSTRRLSASLTLVLNARPQLRTVNSKLGSLGTRAPAKSQRISIKLQLHMAIRIRAVSHSKPFTLCIVFRSLSPQRGL